MAFPAGQRCRRNNEVILGAPPVNNRSPIDHIPDPLEGVHFLVGAGCVDLVKAFVDDVNTDALSTLSVGNSTFQFVRSDLHYERLVTWLERVSYSNLRVLKLGEWVLFHNSYNLYGTLGDVTTLLTRTPRLECLFLSGEFVLKRPVVLNHLKHLEVVVSDLDLSGPAKSLTQETVTNLLNSSFPKLETVFLDLNAPRPEVRYRLPDCFVNAENVPPPRELELAGPFAKGERGRILAGAVAKAAERLFLDEMREE
ncbi:MAG: hypothetical protein AAGE52_26210 [Myxococcota bacterium]